ncbi:MAG TPA: gluconokinase [Propionibacteriaceae bacterium]|nr:gluconokinase [Propionibacteriaceae bacterium]
MTEASLLKTTIVVMGVSGCGKSTVAQNLAERLGWPVAEGDEFHSRENKAKMAAGTPLTDEDRRPWLESIRDWIDRTPSHAIVTCSALKRSYRDILRGARGRVRFLHLDGSPTLLGQRMAARKGHFMPAALLVSQLETLERLGPDEDGAVVDIDRTEDEIVEAALSQLRLTPVE